ncbi:MAG: NAD-dependent epimerase/dehydratase family protein [Lachnospiraceae bacterium]|nr:NAD-dependent epimerase/dehydratase family protein [Lachnospiraceae bacterium]
MLELKDTILQQDMEELASNPMLAEQLKNSTVFITGATGLIGSQVVFALAFMNQKQNTNIRIVAMARSEEKAARVFGNLLENNAVTMYYGDINAPITFTEDVDYIVHGASATSSKYFVTYPVETILTAIEGTKNILEFAKTKALKGMVYLSSLEVYGTPDKAQEHITEMDYGYIDPMSVRSSYSEGKRMVECMCVSYAKEYNVPVKVARLSQTFGAGVEYNDGRVFAEFARCAVEKRDIVLHTQGNTIRTYCYTKDAVSALLYVLLKGTEGEAYNVTNMDTAISIREMAEMVCNLYPQSGIQVKIDIPKDAASFGYNPEMVIRLDSTKLQNLGWKATVGLEEMYRRMIDSSFTK